MAWFGFFILSGLSCMLFPCQGDVQSPSSGNRMTVLPGSTARIIWSFDDDISDVALRSWSFTSTDGSFSNKLLARISNDKNATIYVSFPVIAVEKPATLVLKNVNHSFDGKYKFLLAALSDSFSEVLVFIAVKPNLLLNCSSPATLKEGDNFTCLCRGEGGNPPANVTWFKDEVKFTDGGTEKQTLNLLNVGRTDNGTYKCEVTSYPHENYTEEKSIPVTVYFKPNVTINCSSPIDVRKGDYFICQCLCKDGNPPASCTWLKNGALIGKIRMEKNTLIHRIGSGDGGNYTCVGRSHARAQDKKSVNVSVYYTTIKFSKNPAIFNESVNMTCSSHGLPAPRYVIYYNDSRVVASNMTYTISRVNSTHAGTYKCVANNALKNDSASEYLNVTKPTKSSTTIKPSNTTTTAIPSSSIQNGTNETSRDDKSDETIVIIVVVSCGGVTIIVTVGGVVYKVHVGSDNKSDVNPNGLNGSKVIVNHYEMEEDQVEGGGNTYDKAKPPDGSGEGSHNNAEHNPPESSLPPVYASVNKENRQGNTLYASLDSEALKRPSQKKPAENQPKNVPTEYASIDFMKTAKTPNDDSVST